MYPTNLVRLSLTPRAGKKLLLKERFEHHSVASSATSLWAHLHMVGMLWFMSKTYTN